MEKEREQIRMILYTITSCHKCETVKKRLDILQIPYKEINVLEQVKSDQEKIYIDEGLPLLVIEGGTLNYDAIIECYEK
ncbi:hypothetical protein Q73_02595 [Bacillus coahuilensis m2-6]|uniref:glutaredoxin domain-containing protein n=1 Tax=Bacillus coahuilensis TaxID=408580 RepID=UPI000494B782|nr:glutaredoxin domain-containing protein [Bacillus coahuilensis]KUP09527.1 hypothetical protein Q73_02595 [Bacillus coahuilensis m2-6]